MRPPAGRSTPPYWVLVAFPLAMMLPAPWLIGLTIAAGLLRAVIHAVRAGAGRRARSAAMNRTSEAIGLGLDRAGRPVTLSDQELSAHGLILGASGAGKSTTMLRILTEQVRRGAPVVAIDLKGSPAFAARLSEAARAAGRPFRLWTPDGPGHWNPLQYGNATELKDKLIGTERFTEPHYQRAAERYLQTVLQVLEHAHRGRPPTLEEVVGLMDTRRLKGMLRGLPQPLLERVQDYLADMPHDQVSAIRGLGTRLAILTESHTGRYLRPDGAGGLGVGAGRAGAADRADRADRADEADGAGRADVAEEATGIDLRRALAGPEVVLFSLNSSRYGKLAAQLGTLVIQDVVSAAGERLRAGGSGGSGGATTRGSPAYVAIDEFSGLGGDHVLALVARGREAGVSVLLATQEFVDLDRAGHGLRDQIIGNTVVKIIHRQDVPDSAHLVSQLIGTERVWEETHQIGGPWLGGHATGRGTRREVERFIVHPNQIKRLRPGEAVVIKKVPTASVSITQVRPPAPAAEASPAGPTEPARLAVPGRPAVPAPPAVTARPPVPGRHAVPARALGANPARGAEPSRRRTPGSRGAEPSRPRTPGARGPGAPERGRGIE